HYIIKVANTSSEPRDVKFNFMGMRKKASLSEARVIYLRAADKRAENTLDRPDVVKPYETSTTISGQDFSAVVQPESFAVYIVK
ncbi:MAG: alpha-L-arabinofuranosidase, partial [Duncaniella sp.]|nr:alpha-L-arabinofuranosidase [Duncaniella sp.]